VFQGYTCGIHTTPQRDQGNCRNRSILGRRRAPPSPPKIIASLRWCSVWLIVFRIGYYTVSVFCQGGPLHPLANKKRQGSTGCTAPFSRRKWPFKRVGDDIDPPFQRLTRSLAIPGVNVLSCLAEQIASTISFAAGEPSGRTLLRDGANKTTSSDRAGLPAKHHPSLVLCPFLWDKTRDKTPFVPSPRMAESLSFLEAPREPRVGFELPVPRKKIQSLSRPSRSDSALQLRVPTTQHIGHLGSVEIAN
jgi:hypothetical protein